MLRGINEYMKLVSEYLARQVDRGQFLKVVFAGAFAALMGFSMKPATALGASWGWCETTVSKCGCSPPGGRYCSGCPSWSSSSKCPSGYSVDYTQGWSRTGCWCATTGSCIRTYICCDCKKGSTRCGCQWFQNI